MRTILEPLARQMATWRTAWAESTGRYPTCSPCLNHYNIITETACTSTRFPFSLDNRSLHCRRRGNVEGALWRVG